MRILGNKIMMAVLTIIICVGLIACSSEISGEKDDPMQTNLPADQKAEAYAVSAAVDLPESFGTKVQRLISPDPSDGKMIVMTDDETLYYWGGADGTAETHPHNGQINKITWRDPPASVYLSRFALCYVDTNGTLWAGQLLSSPERLAENIVYAEAFLNAGIALTVECKLCTWNQDSEITEVMQDVRAARSFGDEVFAIKNDDSLWKLSGFGTVEFASSPEAEWVMDGVREISGRLVLLNDGTVRNLDADSAQAAVLGEVTHIASNGIAHAAICSDGSLYLWGTIFLPGNRQESVVVDSPVLLCENVSNAVPCYSGILILKCTGELLACELVNGELITSPIMVP